MERLTISVSEDFAAELAEFMQTHGYANRSEAVRDLARIGLKQARLQDDVAGDCLAALSYVYDHRARDMPKRLTETHHAHHGLEVATLHVHLDLDTCLEVAVLRGETRVVRNLANTVMAERGVNYGALNLIPILAEGQAQAHGPAEPHRPHGLPHPRA